MSAITEQPTRTINVVPSNTVDISVPGGVGAILYIGRSTGLDLFIADVCCMTEGGDSVTFNNIRVGSFLPVKVKRVFVTLGANTTTAADIRASF
jgi:hypothetical protein